jgi:hypothetical protein
LPSRPSEVTIRGGGHHLLRSSVALSPGDLAMASTSAPSRLVVYRLGSLGALALAVTAVLAAPVYLPQDPGRTPALTAAAAAPAPQPAVREPARVDDPPPPPDANGARVEQMEAGRELFLRRWLPNDPRGRGGDGLGPRYNAASCAACHRQGGPGGAGPVDRDVDIVTLKQSTSARPSDPSGPGALDNFHPGFRTASSVVLHRYGYCRRIHGGAANRYTERNYTITPSAPRCTRVPAAQPRPRRPRADRPHRPRRLPQGQSLPPTP